MCFYNFFQKPIIRSIFLHLFVRKKIKWFELASTVLKRRHRFENRLKYTNIWYHLDMNKNTQIFWKLAFMRVLYSLFDARYGCSENHYYIENLLFSFNIIVVIYTDIQRNDEKDLLINQMFIDLRQK